MNELTKKTKHALLREQAYYFNHVSLGFDVGLLQAILNVVPDAQLRTKYPNASSVDLNPITPEEGCAINKALIEYDEEGVRTAVIPTFTPYTEDWADDIPSRVAVAYQVAQVNQAIDIFVSMTEYDKEFVLEMIDTLGIRPDFFNLLDAEDLDDVIDDSTLPLDLEEAVSLTTELEFLDYDAGTLILYIITAYEE